MILHSTDVFNDYNSKYLGSNCFMIVFMSVVDDI